MNTPSTPVMKWKTETKSAAVSPFSSPNPTDLLGAYPNLTVIRKPSPSIVTVTSEKTESDDDSVVEIDVSANESFDEILRKWALSHQITHAALDELLYLLRENMHPELPSNPKDFLSSTRKIIPAKQVPRAQPLRTNEVCQLKPEDSKFLINHFWPESPAPPNPVSGETSKRPAVTIKKPTDELCSRSSVASLPSDVGEDSVPCSGCVTELDKEKKR